MYFLYHFFFIYAGYDFRIKFSSNKLNAANQELHIFYKQRPPTCLNTGVYVPLGPVVDVVEAGLYGEPGEHTELAPVAVAHADVHGPALVVKAVRLVHVLRVEGF